MPSDHGVQRCERCGARVRRTATAAGRRLLVDADPAPTGNTAVYTDGTGRLRSRSLTADRPTLEHLEWRAMPHPATCKAPEPRPRRSGGRRRTGVRVAPLAGVAAVSAPAGTLPAVPDAYGALIAEEALALLGERITPEEAARLGQKTVAAARRDGWHISARPQHAAPDGLVAQAPIGDGPDALRPFERQLLAGLARGRTVVQIAEDTHTRIATVRSRYKRLRTRLHVRTGAQAVAQAYAHGWLTGLLPEDRPAVRLTPRERAVLEAAAAGLSVDRIALRLDLARGTVQTHLRTAYARLDARNQPHAVPLAIQHRHITPTPTRRP
ncbi:hypothetical protein BJP40_02635 [Streptomyces sp. CC53]|uniref:helix-turn-helix transcriptional regulator n=1 Tax=Streptomyces sp. CC53 TaxID=1906740 RepID=UPI0008DCB5D5|nr:LuxR C-terminal-related transcriptional regulator [Streptomyces sp. CC53]OII63795.1 hypothetical protein BJP40_02635 [Streptomyces sp. CC53]